MHRPVAQVLLLLVCALLSAANPTIKIGGTLATCGTSSEISIKMSSTLAWWASYVNSHGGIVINGTKHDVQIVTYVEIANPSPWCFPHLVQIQRRI